ncbi:MAG TPA: DUF1906 domain-containing protein [Solirubrobacteraceae bacterium]|nr:DUF1906 domain-containing protein [Solirubrobacteraceae bacterium]
MPNSSFSVRRSLSLPTLAIFAAALVSVLALAPTGSARAAATPSATKLVHYGRWSARVPRTWPVFHLGGNSHVCVRFNRHAVYLGPPSATQDCPAHAAGRTEAILVSPAAAATGADALGATVPGAGITGGGVAQERRSAEHVVVTATWRRDAAAVRAALGVRSLAAAARAYARGHRFTTRRPLIHANAMRSHVATATTPGAATPGEAYSGLGFDACSAPSATAMSHWLASPFRAAGVYIGGPEMACSQTNLNAAWVSTVTAAGWHLIPIYVGLQAPTNGCGCGAISSADATAQGTAAAQNAVQEAQALGLGAGNPIYDDMENYTRTTSASATVLAYLQGWTTELHALGYLSGVYSSELSGVEDLVAQQGTGYVEPDELWIANWNGSATTTDPQVPATEWANNQRLHQYLGAHTDDYGGSSISIDSDALDAATAAPGSATLTTIAASAPSMAAHAIHGNGTVSMRPTWRGGPGVARWQFLAGASPSSLTAIGSIPSSAHFDLTHNGDPYFQVQALSATGQVLGTSGVTQIAPYVAMFGRSAFVAAHGLGGLPVECYGITACRLSTTIKRGRTVISQTGYARVAAGGGIAHFRLTPMAHQLVNSAGNHGLLAWITIRATDGKVATRPIKLVRFTTTGARPRAVTHASSGTAMRILGGTDFVSNGWSGGVLVACPQATPCSGTPSVTVNGRQVATSHLQWLGAGEVGYLSFRMTSAGHALLAHAPGNHLGATVTVSSPPEGLQTGGTASAVVSLDAF